MNKPSMQMKRGISFFDYDGNPSGRAYVNCAIDDAVDHVAAWHNQKCNDLEEFLEGLQVSDPDKYAEFVGSGKVEKFLNWKPNRASFYLMDVYDSKEA